MNGIFSLAWSRDGALLAGSATGYKLVWDPFEPRLLWKQGTGGELAATAQGLLVSGFQNQPHIVDWKTRRSVREVPLRAEHAAPLREKLAVYGKLPRDPWSRVSLLDADNRVVVSEAPPEVGTGVDGLRDMAMARLTTSLDASALAVLERRRGEGHIRCLSPNTLEVAWVREVEVWAFAFSPDGARLAVLTRGLLSLWDGLTGETIVERPVEGGGIAWSFDGAHLGVGTSTGALWLSAVDLHTERTLVPSLGATKCLAISPDGIHAALAFQERVAIVNLAEGTSIHEQT